MTEQLDHKLTELMSKLSEESWFSLENYPNRTEAKYWAVVIHNRLRLHEDFESSFDALFAGEITEREHVGCYIDIIEGFFRLFDEGELYYNDSVESLHSNLSGPKNSVKPMTPLLLSQLQESVEDTEQWKYFQQLRYPRTRDEEERFFLTPFSDCSDFYFHGGIPFVVDPVVDDETIIRQLKQLLADFRGSTQNLFERQSISAKHFHKWNKYKVLPIFDFMLANSLCGLNKSQEDIAESVWPDGFGDDRTIRGTARIHYQQAFQWTTVRRLRSQLDEQDFRLI